MKQRFWEIDAIRGLAIIKMVIFNYSFALFYLGIYTFREGLMFQGWAAAVFILLAGISLVISYNNRTKRIGRKFLWRGLRIIGYGMLITLVTFMLFPESFIVFGILHFIGVSILLGQFFVKFNKLNIVLGVLILLAGVYLQNFSFDFPWLLWLGFKPNNFYTFDYFPILPWFGFTLLGISLGNLLYKNGQRSFKIKDVSRNYIVRFLSFLGRKSLIIYLLHQPVLILILLLLGFKVF